MPICGACKGFDDFVSPDFVSPDMLVCPDCLSFNLKMAVRRACQGDKPVELLKTRVHKNKPGDQF